MLIYYNILSLTCFCLILNLQRCKSHTFTTAGKSGPQGPTLQEVKQAYSGVTWAQNSEFLNMTKQGIQEWTVPMTGNYKIRALGSMGGGEGGGFGADITGTFPLIKNEVIKILVGQKGTLGKGDAGSKNSGGGGGGSFIVKSDDNILLIAGGGGGGNGDYSGVTSYPNLKGFPANTTQNGTSTYNNGGGINGNGGNKGFVSDTPASGGGGFNTSGENGSDGSTGGTSFKSGGTGGVGAGSGGYSGGQGGFGGGGGGGGYSGGQGGSYGAVGSDGRGGGGGSYSITGKFDLADANNNDNGSVTITFID